MGSPIINDTEWNQWPHICDQWVTKIEGLANNVLVGLYFTLTYHVLHTVFELVVVDISGSKSISRSEVYVSAPSPACLIPSGSLQV
jgi:hypothetical protein